MKPMEEMIIKNTCSSPSSIEKKVIKAAQKELLEALNCPRCNSSNTKFCYYNNYSQTQPRYFCKTCKRYWTQGGSLRSIPVGGKIRNNKRQSYASSSSSTATKIKLRHDLVDQQHSSINPNPKLSLFNHVQDLNLGNFSSTHDLLHPPNNDHSYDHHLYHYKNTHNFNASYLSPMASFMPMQNPNPVYPVGYPFQGDFRPSLGFSLDDFGSVDHNKGAADNHQQDHIGDQLSTRNHDQHEDSAGFWSGNILGGGGSW